MFKDPQEAALLLSLVDDQDNFSGEATKEAVHRLGLLHRAFSVFVVDDKQRLLLHRRALVKYHAGGLWTNSCCGHHYPKQGSMAEQAARRLAEEMGFTLPLEFVGVFHYRHVFADGLIENEWDHVFVGHWQGEPVAPNPQEVMDYAWCSLTDTKARLLAEPDRFTPWFAQALSIWENNP